MKYIFEGSRFGRGLAWALSAVLWCGGGAFVSGARAQQQPAAASAPAQQQPAQGRPRRADDAQPPAPVKPAPKRQDDEITLPQDDEVERVNADLTNVLFTAIDKDKRFITTLRKEDVRVYEDDTAQEIFSFQTQVDLPLTLAIVIDTSISQERTLPDEKNAARSFVDEVMRAQKDEVAVVSFTGDSTLEQGLTGSKARVRQAIDRVEFVPPSGYIGGGSVVTGTPPISGDNQRNAGSTALWDSVWITCDEVLSESSLQTRRAVILITDGEDTSSRMKLDDAVARALKAEAQIFAIGIGDSYTYGVDEGSLKKIADRTGGRAYFPKSEEDLRTAFAQIQRELREQYLVAYSPTNKKRDGSYRRIRIEVVQPELRKDKLKLTYRQGYFAKSGSSTHPTTKRS